MQSKLIVIFLYIGHFITPTLFILFPALFYYDKTITSSG